MSAVPVHFVQEISAFRIITGEPRDIDCEAPGATIAKSVFPTGRYFLDGITRKAADDLDAKFTSLIVNLDSAQNPVSLSFG